MILGLSWSFLVQIWTILVPYRTNLELLGVFQSHSGPIQEILGPFQPFLGPFWSLLGGGGGYFQAISVLFETIPGGWRSF